MSVTPKLQELLDQIAALKPVLLAIGFKPTQSNIREAFANAQRKYMTDIDYTMFAIDDVVYNGKYPVPIRIYRPRLDMPLAVTVFIHGGGHMCGSITQYDGIARKLAKATQQIVVAIDYRLSPEFAYPTGLNDCKAVIRGMFAILDERKIGYTNKNISLIGDSAGAALCASIVMDQKFVKTMCITQQVLLYPSLDYTMSAASLVKYAEGYFLEAARIKWYLNNYLQNNEDRVAISPLYSEFYAEMPATLIISAANDPLCDEAEQYHNNMLKSKAQSKRIVIDNVIHAFLSLEDLCKEECIKTYQEIGQFLTRN